MEKISPKTLGLKYTGDGGGIDWTNMNINSLDGSPTVVKGDFTCSLNPINFLDMPSMVIGGDFRFYFEYTQLYQIKNISILLIKLKINGIFYSGIHTKNGIVDQSFWRFAKELFKRKKAGEDLELLYVEGMNWCCNEGFPSDFWGDL